MGKKLYIPLMDTTLTAENREQYVAWLKRIKADGVFIASLQRSKLLFGKQEECETVARTLGEQVSYFKSHGFIVGIWISSFGFGEPLSDYIAQTMDGEPRITSVSGRVAGDAFCPEGEKFTALNARELQAIAKYAKPDMIMLDDELCLSVRPGLGCFCEKHMRLYEEKFGKAHTREELKELIFTGYNEQYRKGWQQVVGDSMRKFCTAMRKAVDEVDNTIRMGFCSGYTSWDVEGADAVELTKLLAGNTKPFLRFTGAPYWVARDRRRFDAQKLGEVIECTRQQSQWCEGQGIETFCETDTYPRPRYYVPFNICEAFDVALRASGDMGSLKYLFCYNANPDFELGYAKRHERNMPLYDFIDKHFDGKKAVGVRVFDEQRKIAYKTLGDTVTESALMRGLFSPAAGMLSQHSIPTTYGEEYDCGIAFGDTADYVKKFPKKMIIDGDAAIRLQKRGVDVGLVENKGKRSFFYEQFGENMPFSYQWGHTTALDFTVNEKAKAESKFLDINGGEFMASYRYDNGETQFLVLCIDAYESSRCSHAFLSYYRQKQLLNLIGNKYPYIQGQPGVYTLCKDDENERAVLFVNISEDDLFDFEIELDKPYKSAQIFGAEGALDGDKITVTSTIPAYGALAVVLK